MFKKSKNMHKIFILLLFLAVSSFKGYGQDLTLAIANVTCNGLTNGTITINLVSQVNCGPGPYQYQIVGPSPSSNTVTSAVTSSTTYTFTNLAAGTYQINVLTNGVACTSISQSVNQPLALVATPTINLNSATITVNGGSTGGCANPCRGYNVLWTGGNPPMSGGSLNACPPEIITCSQNSINNTYSMTNLSPGTYTITIEDINNCMVTSNFFIPPSSLTVNSTLVNVLCNGNATGSIDLTVSGTAAPYTYLWSTGQTTQDLTNLQAGTYSVTVTDANGGTATTNATITQPQPLSLTTTSVNILCHGNNSGSINATVGGGTPGYTYSWTGPSSFTSTTEDLSNLGPGTYILTVTDANGCIITENWVINPGPQALQLSETNVDVLCTGQSTGGIDLTVVGGTVPYTYSWIGPGPYTANTQDIINLAIGSYSVTVTDANGCQTSITNIDITTPTALTVTGIIVNNNIDLSVGGGTLPYNYSWSNGAVTQDLPNVTPGTYIVIVTDANNCTVSDTFIVNNASIDGNELSEITLFPNPAMDKLTIRGGAGSLAQQSFFVQDCYGRIVAGGSFESDEATVSVEHLAPGLYYLHIGLNSISFVVIH